jgi:RNA polymerase sigma-70 factor (ECF subfamily)
MRPANLQRMSATPTSPAPERALLEAARGGDEDAFRRLVEPYSRELQVHCYRMLGSVHDAEDALQDAMLRAWRGLKSLTDRSALRAWLYRICTNTCLDLIGKRPKRVLPMDYTDATNPHDGPGEPVVESVWVEPYPDELLEVEDGYASPDASYEQREAVELAFIAALQHLPATQRAVLILREVLGYSAKEASEVLDTSVQSVNSALQRARKAVEQKLPDSSQQETLRDLGDEELSELVERYMDAWERNDVETVVDMLAEDATFAMPPLASWFGGREEIAIFLANSPMSGDWRWKPLRVRANGQEALAFYSWDEELGAYVPFALNVLAFEGNKLSNITAFITRTAPAPDREVVLRMPEHEFDARALAAAFGNFNLPERLS